MGAPRKTAASRGGRLTAAQAKRNKLKGQLEEAKAAFETAAQRAQQIEQELNQIRDQRSILIGRIATLEDVLDVPDEERQFRIQENEAVEPAEPDDPLGDAGD